MNPNVGTPYALVIGIMPYEAYLPTSSLGSYPFPSFSTNLISLQRTLRIKSEIPDTDGGIVTAYCRGNSFLK